MRIGILFCFLAFCSACLGEVIDGYKGYKVYRVTVQTDEQRDYLIRTQQTLEEDGLTDEVDFWSEIPPATQGSDSCVLVMVSPGQQNLFLASLDQQLIEHAETIPDLAKAIEAETEFSNSEEYVTDTGDLSWDAFHRYHKIEIYLRGLKSKYPDLVQEHNVIGQSYEGRNLHLLKIGVPHPDGKVKPAVWLDGSALDRLLSGYTTNETSRRMLNEIDWYILPVVNVDGFVYTHAAPSNRLWRRTRNVNPFSPAFGADPNRNYDHKWMFDGADQVPGSDIYAGAYPYSEIENLHVREAILDRKAQLKALISFHSYSQLWLIPWSYNSEKPDDYAELYRVGVEAVNALTALYGTTYIIGTSPDILYASAGGTRDFAKAKAGIKYAYTPELRDQGFYGFLLPPDQIVPSGLETFEAMYVIAQTVHEKFPVA